jgi:hypothetical protein
MKKFFLSGLALGALVVPAIGADVAPYYKEVPGRSFRRSDTQASVTAERIWRFT